MKKFVNVICTIILTLIVLYALFVTYECFRLKKDNYAIPYIVTNKVEYNTDSLEPGEEMEVEHQSLGFKVVTKYALSEESHDDLAFVKVIGREFWLFNEFLLWGWIE